MAATPEKQFLELKDIKGHIEEAVVANIYNRLKPVSCEHLLGKWAGHSFDTGHPTHKLLKDFRWAGKDFRSTNDVDPIMVFDKAGNRKWFSRYGNARLREVKYRGAVSAAMVYDNFPIIDSFRYVADDIVMGAMDNKDQQDTGTYYFYLTRISHTADNSKEYTSTL
ncbi:hypothetical protein EDB81DRAFT_687767 [Dactylonectria macrodidyma]|uniref:Uncharacterized protein n=1 Tax=Dactylonectria macrodidyma TaxID=307937 RepID=A0A9P9J6Y6_9HYPO|nr:hypothetical protein EDB81DRAFT_687767 [Dactylonectria macrodidyma]